MTVDALNSPLSRQSSAAAAPKRAPLLQADSIFGHLPSFRRDPLELMLRAREECGDVARLRVGPVEAHIVFSPEDVRRVLVTNQSNYNKQTRGYNALRKLLGNGLVTSEGSFWRRQRRIAQPAFHHARLANLASVMQRASLDLAERWEGVAAAGGELDVAHEMMEVTLRIAGETLFSVDLSDDSAELGSAVTDTLRYFRVLLLSFTPLGPLLPTAQNRRGRRGIKLLDEAVYRIIAERREQSTPQLDLLGMLMDVTDEDSGEKMSDLQLRDEVITMLTAGHETTANALAWTLYLLSKHPLVLRRVQAELDEVLGDDEVPSVQQLRQLSYTGQTLSESMRLLPPVWMVARHSIEDDVLGGYHVPAGSYVLMSPYCTHRHPDHWDNPEGFDPDRFSPEGEQQRRAKGHSKHAYFPFAAGPRKCIGDHFAKMESVILLATLLKRFEPQLLSHQQVTPEPSVTLRPKHGVRMTLRRR